MGWPECETITSCPYGDPTIAERKGYGACSTCVIPDYSCPIEYDGIDYEEMVSFYESRESKS